MTTPAETSPNLLEPVFLKDSSSFLSLGIVTEYFFV
jgi:hypothetical protein